MKILWYRRHLRRIEVLITEFMMRLRMARVFGHAGEMIFHERRLNMALDHWRKINDTVITSEMEREFR